MVTQHPEWSETLKFFPTTCVPMCSRGKANPSSLGRCNCLSTKKASGMLAKGFADFIRDTNNQHNVIGTFLYLIWVVKTISWLYFIICWLQPFWNYPWSSVTDSSVIYQCARPRHQAPGFNKRHTGATDVYGYPACKWRLRRSVAIIFCKEYRAQQHICTTTTNYDQWYWSGGWPKCV